jgi:uridine kinase
MPQTSVIVGIAGGTGSGKTSFARTIAARLGQERTLLLSQDAYYHDRAHLSLAERTRVNYDHPDAFDTELLCKHLDMLRCGSRIPALEYDYAQHARIETGETVSPRPAVLLEGILVLADALMRERLDIMLFIDTDSDVRLLRRLQRDLLERGRTLESVTTQYLASVRPMHLEFVEPSKRFANLIVPEGAENKVALDLVVARILAMLEP